MSASNNKCCAAHDATLASDATITALNQLYPNGAQLMQGGQPVAWGGKLQISEFAPTQALAALAAQRPIPTRTADGTSAIPTVLKVSTLKLCKQHTTGQCKLGSMCRNIHVCRHAESSSSHKKPTRCESADRQGVRLPPLAAASVNASLTLSARRGAPSSSTGTVNLPLLNTTVVAPDQSCTSPTKSARSARLTGVDASSFKPTPPPSRMSIGVDMEDVVLVSTPVPTPPPRSPAPAVSSGSGCFRRFAKRWNEPLKNGSGAMATPKGVSAANSIDLENVQENVNVLALNDDVIAGDDVKPLPPTNASGEGRCYARRSAFESKEGHFAVFAN